MNGKNTKAQLGKLEKDAEKKMKTHQAKVMKELKIISKKANPEDRSLDKIFEGLFKVV